MTLAEASVITLSTLPADRSVSWNSLAPERRDERDNGNRSKASRLGAGASSAFDSYDCDEVARPLPRSSLLVGRGCRLLRAITLLARLQTSLSLSLSASVTSFHYGSFADTLF